MSITSSATVDKLTAGTVLGRIKSISGATTDPTRTHLDALPRREQIHKRNVASFGCLRAQNQIQTTARRFRLRLIICRATSNGIRIQRRRGRSCKRHDTGIATGRSLVVKYRRSPVRQFTEPAERLIHLKVAVRIIDVIRYRQFDGHLPRGSGP